MKENLSAHVENTNSSQSELMSCTSLLVSIVLGTYNRLELLKKTIDNVRKESYGLKMEIIVIDGGSNDGSIDWLTHQADIITIIQHNRSQDQKSPVPKRSWGYFMNLGFKIAQGKYILMVSDDCILLPGSLQRGLDQFERLNGNNKIGGLAFHFRNWPDEEHYYVQRTLGGKLMVNHGLFLRSALEEVKWIEESYYVFYKADGDLCLKIWEKGYKILKAEGSYVEHYLDNDELVRVQNNRTQKEDAERYRSKWKYHTQVTRIMKNMGKVYCDFYDKSQLAEIYFREYRDQTMKNRLIAEAVVDQKCQPTDANHCIQSLDVNEDLSKSTKGDLQ
jgi:glycosyltransferase involved in cell wall biosynthesis